MVLRVDKKVKLLLEGYDPIIENIQAWKHGPVIPTLWHEFKKFSLYKNIDALGEDLSFDNKRGYLPFVDRNSNNYTNQITLALISFVIDKYK